MTHVAGTRPYPWPYDGGLVPHRTALVAVGCQHWWAARTCGCAEALDVLGKVGGAVQQAGGLVVLVRHGVLAGGPGPPRLPVRRGAGWALVRAAAAGAVVVDSEGVNAFYGSGLDRVLRRRGRDRLLVGGLGLETAVYSTLTGANDRGYECLVLSDASAPHDAAVGAHALSSITMSGGIFGAVGTGPDVVAALESVTRKEER